MTKEEAISIISGYEAYGCGYCLQGDEEVEEALRLAVDALRQETVIRCKDCKYSVDEYGDGDCYCDYDRNLSYIGKNWNHYCGFAERKE